MSIRLSKGCQQCRTRRVKCDEARPFCQRCVKRKEVCIGYRDSSMLLFRSENEKAARQVAHRRAPPTGSSISSKSGTTSGTSHSPPHSSQLPSYAPPALSSLNLPVPFPWAKSVPQESVPAAEDQAIEAFFLKYVMYPCNHSSSPGFLEHLPSLFRESQIEGKVALRWAVRAAAYGCISNEQITTDVRNQALQCYGLSLSALGEALADASQALEDHVLMTVVVLDIFETVFLPNQTSTGSHAGGMAHILRLRGPDQIYDARGWSLFRLAHHRLQRQQLAFHEQPLLESQAWLDSLNEADPQIRIEKDNHEISKLCDRARTLMKYFNDTELSISQTLDMIDEMHTLDQTAVSWRHSPGWKFRTVRRTQLHLECGIHYPDYLQLHRDAWIAYEWNYHRTARIILHQHLLDCLERLTTLCYTDDFILSKVSTYKDSSIKIIRLLVDDILSTVPQSLGDIDHEGEIVSDEIAHRRCRGVGGYFLLWPIKIIKSAPVAAPTQISTAQKVFERIRDYTGMKAVLGDASSI